MRILQVITSMYTGGAEKLITQLAPMMIERGHQCDVALFNGDNTPFKNVLIEAGVNVIDLSVGGSVYNPLLIFKLRKLLKNYDIVHTHNTAPQLFAAIASVLCSTVLCTTEHNTSNRRRDWKWYAPIDKWMYSKYKAVISISPATTTNLLHHTSISCPIYTIVNGIDVNAYVNAKPESRKKLGIKDGNIAVAMVAGFRYQKDQDTVIKAISKLPNNYELLLIGDGERRRICEDLVHNLGLESQVHFLGIRANVASILKAVDIAVLSSHYEGFGLAAVEGMAAGKPVIASNVSGLREVVKGAGLLFEHQDADCLAKIIEDLTNNSEYYNEIARSCQERAKEYDISKMVDGYLNVYIEIV